MEMVASTVDPASTVRRSSMSLANVSAIAMVASLFFGHVDFVNVRAKHLGSVQADQPLVRAQRAVAVRVDRHRPKSHFLDVLDVIDGLEDRIHVAKGQGLPERPATPIGSTGDRMDEFVEKAAGLVLELNASSLA